MLGLDLKQTSQAQPSEPAAPSAFEDSLQTAGPLPDYEIVLGKPQIASLMFLAVVLLVVFSSLAYVVGRKNTSSVEPAPAQPAKVAPTVQAPVQAIPVSKPEVEPKPIAAVGELPVEGTPVVGLNYWQIGALDRGYAVMMVHGLRSQGLTAMMAEGPSSKIFRVLVGPLKDTQESNEIRAKLEESGLTVFLRKYTPDGPKMEVRRETTSPVPTPKLPTPAGAVTTAMAGGSGH
jgi:cell division septation protein DedD